MTFKEEFIKESRKFTDKAQEVLTKWGFSDDYAKRGQIGYYDPSDIDMEDLFMRMVEEDGTDYEKVKAEEPKLVIANGKFLVLRDQQLFTDIGDEGLVFPTPHNTTYSYNTSSLYNDGTVYICTKLVDAMAYEDVGATAVYTPNVNALIQYLKGKKIAKAQVVIAPSKLPDDPSDAATVERYRERYKATRTDFATVPLKAYVSNLIDFAQAGESNLMDVFIRGNERFHDALVRDTFEIGADSDREFLQYIDTGAGNYVQDFAEYIKRNGRIEAISTGFPNLDELLDGGIRGGQLVVVGALSSLGKTTFILQIADNMAEKGHYVQFFTLENGKFEMMGKSISRLTYLQRNDWQEARSFTDIMYRSAKWTNVEKDSVDKAMGMYSEMASTLHFIESNADIYPAIPEIDDADGLSEEEAKARAKEKFRREYEGIGVEDIRHAVENHIRITGKKSVVFVDYLQIIDAKNDKRTDKANMDDIVKRLRIMARDLQVPVIVVSSLNRDNYNTEITFSAFKESGIIEYSSDIVIGLQYEGMSGNDAEKGKKEEKNREIIKKQREKPTGEPKDIELVLLKNRYGKRGTAYFSFVDVCSFFSPKEKKSDWDN